MIQIYFICEGFKRCFCEHTLFTKSNEGGKILIVGLYVDDLIYAGNDKSICDEFMSSVMLDFGMSELGRLRYFLGVKVMQSSNGIFICQRRHACEVLARLGMENSKAVKNPIVQAQDCQKMIQGPKLIHQCSSK